MEFETMGELEYYVIFEKEPLYKAVDQRGYHESVPFTKWEALRTEAMMAVAQSGGQIKYGHSEVGNFSVGDTEYEQNEIEFLPVTWRMPPTRSWLQNGSFAPLQASMALR